MSLQAYRKKRDFRRTPEPAGSAGAKPRAKPGASRTGRAKQKAPIFVVQKHDASRLHYDFRLQVDGALASWAVPKGPSLDPGQKRLAVHVEDHPLDYAQFEGVIPEGEYGAGAVMVWDRGTWEPEDADPAKAIKRGRLNFTLDGEKLHGRWTLTRLHASPDRADDGDNWLLIKRTDEDAAPGEDDAIIERRPESVKSGRSLEEIAEAGGTTLRSEKRAAKKRAAKKAGRRSAPAPARADAAAIPGARAARMPTTPQAQLCTLVDAAPEGDEWIHEIKLDGYRLLAEKDGQRVRLISRNGHDWTGRFAPIAEAIGELPVESALIDGEAAILDSSGHTSFQRLQNAIKARKFEDLVFFVFDLLYLDGRDLTRARLLGRKEALRTLVPSTESGLLRYSDHVRGGGPSVRKNACELALEGIISKRADAPYTPGRSKSWLKVKCSRRQEFVIIGWSPPEGARKHFGSLLLGAYDGDGRLVYAGRVGTGFTGATLRELKKRLDALARKSCPADEPPTAEERRAVHWVKPDLVAEVEFTQWTDDGRLRHPSFQGLREDKPASEVRVEEPKMAVKPASKKAPSRASRTPTSTARKAARRAVAPAAKESGAPVVAGVTISSPERVLYPEQGATKLDVARYYEAVAERILPHVVNRPLSTVRCPRGRAEKCFFQKHLGETLGPPIRALEVAEKSKKAEYISIDSLEGLIALVQFGVLEIHPWGSRADHLGQPDQIIFDLDPAPGVGFDRVKQAARHLREELAGAGLESFLKTTGGKGLHVVAPLEPRAEWDEVKAWCERLAKRMAAESPKEYLATASKAKREGRIFIDYLRNGRGATAVAPYSTRAREGAPVAMPLRWEELSSLDSADKYTIDSAPGRITRQSRDPWDGFFKTRQALP